MPSRHSNGLSCAEFEDKFNQIQASRKRRKKRLENLRQEIDDKDYKLEQLQRTNDALQRSLEDKDREFKSVQDEFNNLNYRTNDKEDEIEKLEDKLNNQVALNEELSKNFKELLTLIEEFRGVEKNYHSELKDIRERLYRRVDYLLE